MELLVKHTFYILLFLIFSTLIIIPLDYKNWNGIDEINDRNLYKRVFDRLYYVSTAVAGVGDGLITPKSYTAKSISIFLHIMAIFGFLHVIRDYVRVV
jgi:hypothetical protein